MKFIVFSTALLLLSGCTASYYDYPDEYKMFRLKGQFFNTNKGYEKVKENMFACGFKNTSNNLGMSDNEWILANICMEQKGYIRETLPKGVCHRYPDSSACQARQKNPK
ncbi:hypothetical protein B0681_04685 [Moraxella porci DSM 25326]|uniref:Lipoprotein n=1 Tax=Moraxella porci DSM 25326 TaxID=573983 RepID=A0A1T0CSK8_9GAMM|nr:hypothetical protein [Moraxella porci]OOS25323.1 hypothetical protein B0681_04685 [Moraxella porci DSM 25326]